TPGPLTKAQTKALEAAFAKGGAWYGLKGSRAGGAYYRMCGRLASLGLVENSGPHPITLKGLQALRDIRAKRWAHHGSMATLIDLEKVEAAIAKAEGR